MADRVKEYSIVINGLTKGLRDTQSLAEAIEKLEAASQSLDETQQKGATATESRSAAMTEEEKASAKLEATRKRLATLDSEQSKAQMRLNQQLRERQRELARQIQIEGLEEGSLERLRLEAAALNDVYKKMGDATPEMAAAREETGRQLDEIRDKIKGLAEATGDFRDSVGHYEKAGESLKPFVQGLDSASRAGMGLAQALLTGNQLLVLFGDDSEETARQAATLQRILATISLVQGLNNNLLRDSIVAGKASILVTKTQVIQTKAKAAADALATKNTIAATVAQKAFNLVAAANPYVLLALAIISVVGGLVYFITRTGDATEAQKKQNEQQRIALDLLEKQTQATQDAAAKRIAALERETAVLEAQGASAERIERKRLEILEERKKANAEAERLNKKAVDGLRGNLAEAAKLDRYISILESRLAGGDLPWRARENAEEMLEVYRGVLENLRKEIAAGEAIVDERAQIETDAAVLAAQARQRARAQGDATLAEERKAQDARMRLIKDGRERERAEAEASYTRQIEDLRTRLAREADLTVRARAALNDQIASLAEERRRKLLDIDRNYRDRLLRAIAEAEDEEIKLERDGFERRRQQMEAQQERERAALVKNIGDEQSYTEQERAAFARRLRALEERWLRERTDLVREELDRRYELEESAAELFYARFEAMRDRLAVRKRGGLGLIDVEATEEQYDEAIAMLGDYVARLYSLRAGEEEQHARNLESLREGTVEFEEEMQRHEQAIRDITQRIGDAQREQSTLAQDRDAKSLEYYGELAGKMEEVAGRILEIGSGAASAINEALQAQLDSINEQMEAIDERLEETTARREAAAERVEELEERMREASGSTAEALRVQLQEEMASREAAAREENRLARERERLEREAARKEKQMRRAELVMNIATGISNTAVGATKAFEMGPIIGPILAAMISALGAVQVAIMTQQLTKLADGGMLHGPTHAEGGMRVAGTNIEVEGGEFVENRASTRYNRALLEFINDAGRSRPLTLADLAGIVPGGNPGPAIMPPEADDRTDEIIEAIRGMEFHPVVAVTDIIDRANDVVAVRDLAGYDG